MAVNRLHIFYDIDCWFAMSYTEHKLIYSHILYAEHTRIAEPKKHKIEVSCEPGHEQRMDERGEKL